ncbi:MAG TPA: CopG family transcriptional regulator [Clostridiales bacterium]|jgi:predicted DNA-binding protein|nr:MAG TPA: Alginate and motility regulator [Caudoviricetes sp.]HCE14167.1 CopG family transcriptional regulator [Clostridiales bacterium]HCV67961.1 CopG family transcriptional regulator [Clostridiales bacterium]
MSPQVGRPKAENPKDKELRVRIDKETEQTLKELAQHYNVSVSVVVRMGIERLYTEIKK